MMDEPRVYVQQSSVHYQGLALDSARLPKLHFAGKEVALYNE
jgi:hypothetical protein